MKSLVTYINESVEKKFNKYVSESDDILDKCPRIRHLGIEDVMNQYFDDLIRISKYHPKELFIYSDTQPYFKIPYAFFDEIRQLEADYPQLSIKVEGNKIYVSYKGKKLFETGSGSVGRISTEQQEMSTCMAWNLSQEGHDVNKIVYGLGDDFDTGWKETFKKQVELITKYLKSFGLRPSDYRLVRFGYDDIGKAYKNFITAYTKQISGRRDNYDPSDVLLYSVKDSNNIISELKSYKCKDINDAINCRKEFVQKLFSTNKLVGLSLKKIPGNKPGNFETFNIGVDRVVQVNNFTQIGNSKTQVCLHCTGKFDFGETQSSVLKLVMRSFGSGVVAVDVAILSKKEPALGKCSVNVWRDELNLSPKDNLKTCVEAFKNHIRNNPNTVNDLLTRWIKSAIKEGPNCFPFVLIH